MPSSFASYVVSMMDLPSGSSDEHDSDSQYFDNSDNSEAKSATSATSSRQKPPQPEYCTPNLAVPANRGIIRDNRRDIAELRRRCNALLPISYLPASVLAHIFDSYRRLHIGAYPSSRTEGRLELLTITHVCQSWRAIASSYGKLWTDINAIYPKHVRHWLARSARCPLHVEAWSIPSRNQRALESDTVCLVLEQLPRIRTLSLFYVGFTKAQVSTSNWQNSPAPLLQSLTIKAGEDNTYGSEDDDKSFCLAAMFLRRDLPNLTHLRIEDSRFLSDCVKFPPSLTHLAVGRMDPTAGWKPHMVSVLLAVLDTLPSLESLELSWYFWEDTQVAAPVTLREVTLPRLQDLTLNAERECHLFVWLLNHLVFPSTAKINLQGQCRQHEFVTTFVEDIAAKFNGRGVIGDTRPLRSFFIGSHKTRSRSFVMKGWAEAHAPQGPAGIESKPDITISVDTQLSSFDSTEIIRTVCDAMPLSQVENLAIGYICLEVKAETFKAISRNMPALHTLYIRGWGRERKSGKPPACLTSNPSEDVQELFPSLKILRLEFLKRSYKSASTGFLKFLMEFLSSRKERGAAVERLHLRRCKDVDQSDRKLLRELVDKMILDPAVFRLAGDR